jgi:hypothetical protein
MKLAFFILTSSNIQLLKAAFESVLNQQQHSIHYSIYIVVNTKNTNYYSQVAQEFLPYIPKDEPKNGSLQNIISTPSNGYPGKGHQSCIDLFRELLIPQGYTHATILDGDDSVFPCYLHQIEKLNSEIGPLDYIVTQSNERITKSETHFPLGNNLYYDTLADVSFNRWIGVSLQNPINTHISACGTLTRLLLISSKIFEKGYNSLFLTEAKLHDDYLAFLVGTDIYFNHPDLNFRIVPATYFYLYNAINDDSITYKSKYYEYQYDHELLLSLKNKYRIFQDWRLADLPFYPLTSPRWYSIENKREFARWYGQQYLNALQQEADNLFTTQTTSTNKIIELYRRLIKIHGIGTSKNLLNLATCYYRDKNVEKSVEYFNRIIHGNYDGIHRELAAKNLLLIHQQYSKQKINPPNSLTNIIHKIKNDRLINFAAKPENIHFLLNYHK